MKRVVLTYKGTAGGYRQFAYDAMLKAGFAGLGLPQDAARIQCRLNRAMAQDRTKKNCNQMPARRDSVKDLRKFKNLLVALGAVCQGISEEVHLIGIDYSRDQINEFGASVHIAPKQFEAGHLPIERLQYRPGGNYVWRMECRIGGVTIKSLCSDDEICKMPIGDDTEISPEAARYLRFLMTEKERELSGVAGN